MEMEVLYVRDCPHFAPAMDRLRAVLREEGLRAEISEIEVKDEAAAKAWKFPGSPTIRVNGRDIDPETRTGAETGLACRRYDGGSVSEEMICAALRATHER
jgi:uncharacterized protein DUF2703